MLGRDLEILGERAAVQSGDIEQDSAAQNGSEGVDREAGEPGGLGLERSGVLAPVKAAVAGKMAQGVDVSPHVSAQGESFGGGAIALGPDVLAVLFHHPEQERRMAGVVRHAGEVGLGEIEDASAGKKIEQGGHSGSLQDGMSAVTWSFGL
jgi:hypothetical protein